MSTRDEERYKEFGRLLKFFGPLLVLAGLVFIIIGVISFLPSFDTPHGPRLFWCAFAGVLMVVVGAVLSKNAFFDRR